MNETYEEQCRKYRELAAKMRQLFAPLNSVDVLIKVYNHLARFLDDKNEWKRAAERHRSDLYDTIWHAIRDALFGCQSRDKKIALWAETVVLQLRKNEVSSNVQFFAFSFGLRVPLERRMQGLPLCTWDEVEKRRETRRKVAKLIPITGDISYAPTPEEAPQAKFPPLSKRAHELEALFTDFGYLAVPRDWGFNPLYPDDERKEYNFWESSLGLLEEKPTFDMDVRTNDEEGIDK